MAHKLSNPLSFTPGPVTLITFVVYFVFITAILVVHLNVPRAPDTDEPVRGISLSEAWRDLQVLSDGFRPYNSRRNDQVRDWLLRRIESILANNGLAVSSEAPGQRNFNDPVANSASPSDPVVIFNDVVSNVTFSSPGANRSVYFEGNNIMIYIRGENDDIGAWWADEGQPQNLPPTNGGVLVNAHFDGVSTGRGTTDDGVGVITVLQLISHFTASKPMRGLVLLLNNGEEDYLNGARAFTAHPLARFPRTFLNLEGAGAGGRATLFRTTSTEVTRSYKNSDHPFGTVASDDGFKKGLVRSQTDYIIFNGDLGMQGLDVAFMAPRSRYHTPEDTITYTSKDSMWHMLSAAIATTRSLTDTPSAEFDPNSEGTRGVWFDLFGKALLVFQLKSLFALSVTLLVVTPLVFVLLAVVFIRNDRWYLFSSVYHSRAGPVVPIEGWKGFFRFPVAYLITTVVVIGLAFLMAKVNPYIAYSSEYAVWSMMMTAWLVMEWFVLRGADATRPSGLTRLYGLFWIYVGTFAIVVAVTVAEDQFNIAGGYCMVTFFLAASVAFLLSCLEIFTLPKKDAYAQETSPMPDDAEPQTPTAGDSGSIPSPEVRTDSTERAQPQVSSEGDGEVTETTSLLREDRRTTFARYGQRRASIDGDNEADFEETELHRIRVPYDGEQQWSAYLPQWLWVVQFLILAPVAIVLVGQIGLVLTSALHQTSADGSPVLTVYLSMAVMTVLILSPLAPFIHRVSFVVPTFFLFIFIGTLIYNLVAFPFSGNNKLKLYFLQEVDLESGENSVSLTGIDAYMRQIVGEIPSAAGEFITCGGSDLLARSELTKCTWNGPPPRAVQPLPPGIPPEKGYREWLSVKVTRFDGEQRAKIELVGRNTRACRLSFDTPVKDFYVEGAASSDKYDRVGPAGSTEIRLWSREWEAPWVVHVEWDGERTLGAGKAVCLWSDVNQKGTIPAFDEVRTYLPAWAIVSKLSDGLVEGSKSFIV